MGVSKRRKMAEGGWVREPVEASAKQRVPVPEGGSLRSLALPRSLAAIDAVQDAPESGRTASWVRERPRVGQAAQVLYPVPQRRLQRPGTGLATTVEVQPGLRGSRKAKTLQPGLLHPTAHRRVRATRPTRRAFDDKTLEISLSAAGKARAAAAFAKATPDKPAPTESAERRKQREQAAAARKAAATAAASDKAKAKVTK
eukprot:jgi/Tetstr1/466578/TSEL_011080.t1